MYKCTVDKENIFNFMVSLVVDNIVLNKKNAYLHLIEPCYNQLYTQSKFKHELESIFLENNNAGFCIIVPNLNIKHYFELYFKKLYQHIPIKIIILDSLYQSKKKHILSDSSFLYWLRIILDNDIFKNYFGQLWNHSSLPETFLRTFQSISLSNFDISNIENIITNMQHDGLTESEIHKFCITLEIIKKWISFAESLPTNYIKKFVDDETMSFFDKEYEEQKEEHKTDNCQLLKFKDLSIIFYKISNLLENKHHDFINNLIKQAYSAHFFETLHELQHNNIKLNPQIKIPLIQFEYINTETNHKLPPILQRLNQYLFSNENMNLLPISLEEKEVFQIIAAKNMIEEISAIIQTIEYWKESGIAYSSIVIFCRDINVYATKLFDALVFRDIPFVSYVEEKLNSSPFIRCFLLMLSSVKGATNPALLKANNFMDWVEFSFTNVYQNLNTKIWQDRFIEDGDITTWRAFATDIIDNDDDNYDIKIKKLLKIPTETNLDSFLESNWDSLNKNAKNICLFWQFFNNWLNYVEIINTHNTVSFYVEFTLQMISDWMFFPAMPNIVELKEFSAKKKLTSLILDLNDMELIYDELSYVLFLDIIISQIEKSIYIRHSDGTYDEHIVVSPFELAEYISCDKACVIGMVNGLIPKREYLPLFINNSERKYWKASGVKFYDNKSSLKNEELLFYNVIASAKESLAFFWHRNNVSGKPTLPSTFFRDIFSCLLGNSTFEKEDIDSVVYSFSQGKYDYGYSDQKTQNILQKLERTNQIEFDNIFLSKENNPFFTEQIFRSFYSEYQRWLKPTFSNFDGVIGNTWKNILQNKVDNDNFAEKQEVNIQNIWSASRLELLATCPFRYLFTNIWKSDESSSNNDSTAISPITRGNLYHQVLEDIIKWRKDNKRPNSNHKEWLSKWLSYAEGNVEKHILEYKTKNIITKKAIWKYLCSQIKEDILDFINAEATNVTTYEPYLFEKVFNIDIKLNPLEVSNDIITVRGKIDRIDIDWVNKKAYIYDYKTSTPKSTTDIEKQIKKGTLLQAPIYISAALQLLPNDISVDAFSYYYVYENTAFKNESSFTYNSYIQEKEGIIKRLSLLLNLYNNGVFFPDYESSACSYCSAKLLCRRSPVARFENKVKDPWYEKLKQ